MAEHAGTPNGQGPLLDVGTSNDPRRHWAKGWGGPHKSGPVCSGKTGRIAGGEDPTSRRGVYCVFRRSLCGTWYGRSDLTGLRSGAERDRSPVRRSNGGVASAGVEPEGLLACKPDEPSNDPVSWWGGARSFAWSPFPEEDTFH